MARNFIFVAIILAALSIAPAVAQDIVVLKNGERIPGAATDGLLEVLVSTPSGDVTVPWSRIERIERESFVLSVYEERRAALAADDAEGRFLLALWCRRQGLAEPMTAELRRVLEIRPDHPGARAALGFEKVGEKWVAGDEILAAKGFVRRDGRWILEEEARYADLVKERAKALTEPEEKASELLDRCVDANPRVAKYAREAFAALPWEAVRTPLYRALGDRRPELRVFAAGELARFRERESVRPLLRTAILDRETEVRTAAVTALRAVGEPQALLPMARALASGNARIRENAAGAIGGFGDVRGVEYLVRRLSQNWGPSSRVNMSVTNQVSYIKDFDVEIAQAAQIGDPIVGILREGIILDVRVLGASRLLDTVERRMIRSALVNLTGQDQGDEALAWEKWWGENKSRLLAEAR